MRASIIVIKQGVAMGQVSGRFRLASLFAGLTLAILSTACTTGAGNSATVEYFSVPGSAQLPFSEAVRVGNMLYLAGQIGTRSMAGHVTGIQLVEGGIEAETRQTMENIKAVLERHGSSLADVVKCTVMMADMREWPAMNAVYVTYFEKDRLPARSALGANGLALGARVEIECIAVVR